mgnify:CR=1 FL=1
MEWISINNYLPAHNEYTLCWDGKDIYILKFRQTTDKRHKKRNGRWDVGGEKYFFDDITHWSPLPKPPSEK